jgi:pSer/pThr/pTyr-binding forkhead associated (FHA) protein
MVREIEQAGYECDYYFHSPPTIRVIPDARVGLNEIRAQATFSSDDLGQTSSLEGKQDRVQGSPPSGGYLIIGGKQIFPIQSTVINIGRNPLNDLVIDDLRISREHAQLRVIHGRYVIFDLDSTGGTLMNGQRVIQGILSPGDTLSLAGVPLIFSQDNPGEFGETRPYHPEEGE